MNSLKSKLKTWKNILFLFVLLIGLSNVSSVIGHPHASGGCETSVSGEGSYELGSCYEFMGAEFCSTTRGSGSLCWVEMSQE